MIKKLVFCDVCKKEKSELGARLKVDIQELVIPFKGFSSIDDVVISNTREGILPSMRASKMGKKMWS